MSLRKIFYGDFLRYSKINEYVKVYIRFYFLYSIMGNPYWSVIEGWKNLIGNNYILRLSTVSGTEWALRSWLIHLFQNPLVVVKRYPFDPAYRRGSPLKKWGGWGSLLDGVWGRFPQWVWAKPKVCFCHAGHGSAKPKSVADPYWFWYEVSKYV